jgi:hypothetical protein
VLLAAMAVTAGAAYALQKAHYATLTCMITATVVLLLTLGRADVVPTAEHRLIATVLGGVIAPCSGARRPAPASIRPLRRRPGRRCGLVSRGRPRT